MKLSRTALSNALQALKRIADPRQTLPILGNVLIEPGDQGKEVKIAATNLEQGLSVWISSTPEPGDVPITVNANTLADIVKAFPKSTSEICLEYGEDRILVNGVSLPSMPAIDFPSADRPKDIGEPIRIPGLFDALRRVIPAASTDVSRYALNGVLVDFQNSAVVTTDGHRMHVADITIEGPRPRALKDDVILPREFVYRLISPAMRKLGAQEALTLGEKGGSALVPAVNGSFYCTRLIDGQFPNYQAVIPKQNGISVTVPRVGLIEALRQGAVLRRDDRNRTVTLVMENGTVVVEAATDGMRSQFPVAGASYSKEIVISINATYLETALTHVNSEHVTLKLKDALSPIRVDDQGYTSIIMPLRADRTPAQPPVPVAQTEAAVTVPAVPDNVVAVAA